MASDLENDMTRKLVVDGLADNYDGHVLHKTHMATTSSCFDGAWTFRVFEEPKPEQLDGFHLQDGQHLRIAEIKLPASMLDELKELSVETAARVRVTVEVMGE